MSALRGGMLILRSKCINSEIEASFWDKRFRKRLSFASFARVGNDQLLLELRTSAIKPKQNEGSERLVSEELFSDFFRKLDFNYYTKITSYN